MKKLLSLLLLGLAFLSSCEYPDGLWDPMKWKTNIPKLKSNHIEVPNTGGTYTLKCKNYGSFWIFAVNGILIRGEECANRVTGEWYVINIEKNIMTVNILPNNGDNNRILDVRLSAGDIFSTFIFEQSKAESVRFS